MPNQYIRLRVRTENEDNNSNQLFEQLCAPGQNRLSFKRLVAFLRQNGYDITIYELTKMRLSVAPRCCLRYFESEEFGRLLVCPKANNIFKEVVNRSIANNPNLLNISCFSALLHHLVYLRKRQEQLDIIQKESKLEKQFKSYVNLINEAQQLWVSNKDISSAFQINALVPKSQQPALNQKKVDNLPIQQTQLTSRKNITSIKLTSSNIDLQRFTNQPLPQLSISKKNNRTQDENHTGNPYYTPTVMKEQDKGGRYRQNSFMQKKIYLDDSTQATPSPIMQIKNRIQLLQKYKGIREGGSPISRKNKSSIGSISPSFISNMESLNFNKQKKSQYLITNFKSMTNAQ